MKICTQLCIISADILQTICAAMDLKWVRSGYLAEVAEVPFAQGDSSFIFAFTRIPHHTMLGALKQIGIVLGSLVNNGTFLP